jgi:hypothetical protein
MVNDAYAEKLEELEDAVLDILAPRIANESELFDVVAEVMDLVHFKFGPED